MLGSRTNLSEVYFPTSQAMIAAALARWLPYKVEMLLIIYCLLNICDQTILFTFQKEKKLILDF